jgi:membrane dipeptidase
VNYFDAHADTLTEIKGETLTENSCDLDLRRVRAFSGSYGQVFALWKDRKLLRDSLEAEFHRLLRRALSLIAQSGRMRLCRTKEELEAALADGKAAALLAVEDLSLMGAEVEHIRELGMVSAMLTWNYENEYAFGAASNQAGRLKEKGREAVRHLLAQRIVLDISHLSDGGVEELFSMTDRPVIASHSNVRELCDQPRNLRRDQILEIIRRGGIIGINFYRPFVGSGGTVKIQDLLRHMEYILELGGENALTLGTDFDGCDGQFPEGITGVESIPSVAEAMCRSGFGETLVEKILFRNAADFWSKNLPSK